MVGKQVLQLRRSSAGGVRGKRSLGPPCRQRAITHLLGGCDSPALFCSHAPCAGTVKMFEHVSDERNSPHHHRHGPDQHICIPPSPPSVFAGPSSKARRHRHRGPERSEQLRLTGLPASPKRKATAQPWKRLLISVLVGTGLPGLLQEEAWLHTWRLRGGRSRHMSFWQAASWRSKRVPREGTEVYASPVSPQAQLPGAAGKEQGGWRFLTCRCDRFLSPRAR